jgi:hypothetical protein
MPAPVLPPIGNDWRDWGRQLTLYLRRTLSRLQFKNADDIPADNGIILWDEENGYPVVSKDNEFRQIVLADGYASFTKADSVAFAIADTEQVITYDTPVYIDGITQGTPTSRIVFEEGGNYLLSFTAQIYSTSASTVHFYFWPKINNVVSAGNTIKANLHGNSETIVVSRSSIFTVNANDYLEVACACSSTDGSLNAFSATAFAPATPSTTLAITRISA